MAHKNLGIMLDCSRNAVMKPEKVKEFACLIREMGYSMLQLYTEDTYEIHGEPFFGYMRGRYSQEELKDIDSYCASIGIELVPCIQVLAHLNQLTQWPEYQELFDCHDIMMVGEEKVYDLIEKMFQTLKICFTSRKVNIGMDEAHFLGRGGYQDRHGYRDSIDVFLEHLCRVKEIADKHGFSIMMWSDMFIRMHNQGQYETCEGEIKLPQETIDRVPDGIELIYWDYYSKDKRHYDNLLNTHEKFHNPISFAGGVQTGTGYAPNLKIALDTTEAAMQSVQEHDVNTVLITAWGDGGNDCSYYATLPALFAGAKMAQGCFDRKQIALEFEQRCGYSFQEFMNLELSNITKEEPSHFHNPSKYLLFNDPFLGLYDFSVVESLPKRYEQAANTLTASINGRKYDYLFDMHKKLLDVLRCKAYLSLHLRKAYQTNDRDELNTIANNYFPLIIRNIKEFARTFRAAWLYENKPFGLEVQEQRFGGLIYRMETCEERLRAYLNGEVDAIEELEMESLTKYKNHEGQGIIHTDWGTTVTTSVI